MCKIYPLSSLSIVCRMCRLTTMCKLKTENKMAVRKGVPDDFDEKEFIKLFRNDPKPRSKSNEEESATKPELPRKSTSETSKSTLKSYRANYMTVPKIEDRKPPFISCHLRDEIDEVIRRFGARGMSVSGFVENLVRHHLESHRANFEKWRKL